MSARPIIHLQLCLPPEWEPIESVRQAVSLCAQAVFGDSRFCDAVSMVSSELLENAVKYGQARHPVLLVVEERPDEVIVRVVNRVVNGSKHVKVLLDRIAWMKSFDTPMAMYTAALEAAYHDPTGGGLGIVRVVYEGGCRVECEVLDSGDLCVTARCDGPRRRASSVELCAETP